MIQSESNCNKKTERPLNRFLSVPEYLWPVQSLRGQVCLDKGYGFALDYLTGNRPGVPRERLA